MAKREQEQLRNSRKGFRMAGLDIAHCDTMKTMKRAASEASLREDKEHGRLLQTEERVANAVAAILEDKTRKTHRECVEYSLANLRKENRREYYLSDPNQLKNDLPIRREGYKVPMCSFQEFEGESGEAPEAIKKKYQEHSAWINSQMAEKKARHENARDLDRFDDEALLYANHLRHACEAAKQEEYTEELKDIVRTNQQLALEKRAREDAWRVKNQKANDEHSATTVVHNLARERHDFEIGADGKRRDCKRQTIEEEQDCWDYNALQMVGKVAEKRAEAKFHADHAQIDNHLDMVTKALDDEKARRIRARREEIEAFNRGLVQQKKQRDATEKAGYGQFSLSR
jgi:hypothetical protein